ncbi:hypothetical protein MNBD_ALPHA04-1853 [hydrothermal vent metagenome]|uniref:LysM domain-containing protein n=1 Tax=hydrothermal vent metagenome TaxID=652676 RepID=A0A3B0T7W8_9ZZZZ
MAIGRLRFAGSTRWAVAASIFLAVVPAQAQSPAGNERAEYIFKRGDTLIDLATKYLRKPSDYRIVQRLNRIANPHFIPVGKKVHIPFRLLKYRSSEARLSAFRGKVSIVTGGRQIAASKGLDIAEGSQLITSAGSFLTLRLEDGSRISMPSNSKVRITRLRHILLTDSIDYEFALDNGRIRSKVTPFDKKADRYRVRTPVAVSAVRGTDYRTRVDESTGTAFSETIEGDVDVAAGNDIGIGKAVSVPAGTGAAASITGDLAKEDLLSPPELLEAAKVQSDAQLQFRVVPSGKATGHRIVVSTDAGFVDIVAEEKVDGAAITLPTIPDGRYFAKATAIAPSGFEGMPAAYAFKRQLSTLSGSAGKGDFGYRFKWDGEGSGKRIYRFQLLKGSKKAIPIVDEDGLLDDVLTLSDLPDGEYYWRVGVTQFSDGEAFQKWTEFEKLTVAG